jgi:hypothetical protein
VNLPSVLLTKDEHEKGKIKEKAGNVWWVGEIVVILHDFCASLCAGAN